MALAGIPISLRLLKQGRGNREWTIVVTDSNRLTSDKVERYDAYHSVYGVIVQIRGMRAEGSDAAWASFIAEAQPVMYRE